MLSWSAFPDLFPDPYLFLRLLKCCLMHVNSLWREGVAFNGSFRSFLSEKMKKKDLNHRLECFFVETTATADYFENNKTGQHTSWTGQMTDVGQEISLTGVLHYLDAGASIISLCFKDRQSSFKSSKSLSWGRQIGRCWRRCLFSSLDCAYFAVSWLNMWENKGQSLIPFLSYKSMWRIWHPIHAFPRIYIVSQERHERHWLKELG